MVKISIHNIEVEKRARLDDPDLFKEKILALGVVFAGEIYIRDIYFCDRSVTTVEEVEMNTVGSYSLRLRKEKQPNMPERVTLNTKTITKHGDHSAWEEHEVEVGGLSEAANILKTTEFKPYLEIEKNRSVYRMGDMEICIEDIKDFGGAVEVEIMCSAGKEEESKEKIKDFLRECGLDDDHLAPKSITNIIMKERAFKQEILI